MDKITDQIYIGSSSDARYAGPIKEAGIHCVLNVAEDLQSEVGWKDEIFHYQVGLRDADNDRRLYEAALAVLGYITSDWTRKVLVHCHEGSSRSCYIVACHLVNTRAFPTLDKALEYIAKCGRVIKVVPGHFESYKPNPVMPSTAKAVKSMPMPAK